MIVTGPGPFSGEENECILELWATAIPFCRSFHGRFSERLHGKDDGYWTAGRFSFEKMSTLTEEFSSRTFRLSRPVGVRLTLHFSKQSFALWCVSFDIPVPKFSERGSG